MRQTIFSILAVLWLPLAGAPAGTQPETKQTQPLCYAFWLDGDVYTNCQGHREKVTHFADVESFAVDPNGKKLVLTRHQAKVQGRGVFSIGDDKPHYYFSHSALQIITLSGDGERTLSPLNWPMDLHATCGTVLGPLDVANMNARPVLYQDVLKGEQIRIDPYIVFRCSSDRKTVVGFTDLDYSALRIGLPPQKVLPGLEGSTEVYYDVSPGGEYVAYIFSNGKVGTWCVFATDTQITTCIHEFISGGGISVADTGQVLYQTERVEDCYENAHHFSTKKLPGYTASIYCTAISYWRPGDAKPIIVESLGAQPQWISPETASALTAWGARSQTTKW